MINKFQAPISYQKVVRPNKITLMNKRIVAVFDLTFIDRCCILSISWSFLPSGIKGKTVEGSLSMSM